MTKRKNWIVIILTIVVMSVFLTGCSESSNHESKDIKDEEVESETKLIEPMILIKKEKIKDAGVTQYIYYDPETMVMFTHFSGINDYGISEMHNSDGSLRTYDGKSDVEQLILITKVKIEDTSTTEQIYYDPETLVMYVHYTNVDHKGMSEMHNSDGTLRTYTP